MWWRSNGTNNVKQESNPFEEEEWDEDGGEPLVDNGEPGVPVRALYDYEGAEADELSFKQGMRIFYIEISVSIRWFIDNCSFFLFAHLANIKYIIRFDSMLLI